MTLFQTKKNVIFHTRFQTRPLKSIPLFLDLAFRQKLCYHYLDKSAIKKLFKSISNPPISFSFVYSFGIETITTFIHSRSSLENHTRFQTKMGKVKTRFQTKIAYTRESLQGRVLSVRSKGLRLDESWLYTKSLLTLRVISVKFLLVITLLYKTEWSWELRTWSHKMNLIDTSTNSPHFFYWKRIGITNENLNVMLGFKGLRSQRLLWGFLIKRIVLPFFCQ